MGEKWLDSSSAERGEGVLIDSRLYLSQWCALAAKRANHVWDATQHSQIVKTAFPLVQPYPDYCRAPQYEKYVKVHGSIQRRATKLVEGLDNLSYEKILRSLE